MKSESESMPDGPPPLDENWQKQGIAHQVSNLKLSGVLHPNSNQGVLKIAAAGLFEISMELQDSYREVTFRRPGEDAETHLARAQEFSPVSENILKTNRMLEQLLGLDLKYARHHGNSQGDPDLRDPQAGAAVIRSKWLNDTSWIDKLPPESEEMAT